tara:strand:+ start:88 stop:1293 length:1206 start_codon:yes stop_codon:yes gene_type:complete
MTKVLKLSQILEPKNLRVEDMTIQPMSCTNEGIFLREEKFSKNLSKSLAKNKIAHKGDFIFGMSRKILNFGMMKFSEGSFSSAYKVYKCKFGYEFSVFLDLYIRLNHDYFFQCISGGAREGQSISEDILFNLEVNVPDNNDIENLVRIVDFFNSKIELYQQTNETLEEIVKTLFKSWFIDFDPVRAKAEGRSTGLSKEISDLFPDSFEDSELGEMPSGWKVGNLGNLCFPKRGKVITKAKVEPGNFPVVAGGIKPPYYHSEPNAESPIVTISASGTAGFVNLYYEDIWASDCSYINKEITDNVFFIYSFLKINQQRIYDLRHGAVQQHVYPKDLIELPIFLSSNSLIEEYEKIATSFHEKISLNIQESKHLEAIRDTLLPRLISGVLQIPDAENVVKEAGI